jgi:hypothetical protein
MFFLVGERAGFLLPACGSAEAMKALQLSRKVGGQHRNHWSFEHQIQVYDRISEEDYAMA